MNRKDPYYKTALLAFAKLCPRHGFCPRSCLGEYVDKDGTVVRVGNDNDRICMMEHDLSGYSEQVTNVVDQCLSCSCYAGLACSHPLHPDNAHGIEEYVLEEL
jgi:hypothetical protein